ncbi:hypothetical protein [Shewanella sp. UCD-KL12]|uniref:hypothetical protein n=1 Tax=Shewanella sp. UCD-KL12 TaxID=1917163 RepID=UPI0009703953|nr:hypothetical protein [Shewanella sp. UCD-KL12]
MESIIHFDEILDLVGTPENKLKRYQRCLKEFESLNYDDPFIQQIRKELIQLEISLNPHIGPTATSMTTRSQQKLTKDRSA